MIIVTKIMIQASQPPPHVLGLTKQSKYNLLRGHALCKSLSSQRVHAANKILVLFPPVEMLVALALALVPGDTEDFVMRSYLKKIYFWHKSLCIIRCLFSNELA
jgi:hypothetical protein